jgi:hypothetical protein
MSANPSIVLMRLGSMRWISGIKSRARSTWSAALEARQNGPTIHWQQPNNQFAPVQQSMCNRITIHCQRSNNVQQSLNGPTILRQTTQPISCLATPTPHPPAQTPIPKHTCGCTAWRRSAPGASGCWPCCRGSRCCGLRGWDDQCRLCC